MKNTFRFKQFTVDQSNCGMKINTDGVLLGALAEAGSTKSILDIGTGTGVIALMLAQRFPSAVIEAVEIDQHAAQTATENFFNSPFADRLSCYYSSFEAFYTEFTGKKFDLILSNPPFFLNSLKNPDAKKQVARHTDADFFQKLLLLSAEKLSEEGSIWLILPVDTLASIRHYASECGLVPERIIRVRSFADSKPHRSIVSLSKQTKTIVTSDFIIYKDKNAYSDQYRQTLKDFFIIF